jgi:hypothetical protein
MYLIKDFCKPFFWQTICLWLQRLCERQSEREIIEEEQMANHSWKEILFVIVTEEEH